MTTHTPERGKSHVAKNVGAHRFVVGRDLGDRRRQGKEEIFSPRGEEADLESSGEVSPLHYHREGGKETSHGGDEPHGR